jgi:hypothetical protein
VGHAGWGWTHCMHVLAQGILNVQCCQQIQCDAKESHLSMAPSLNACCLCLNLS